MLLDRWFFARFQLFSEPIQMVFRPLPGRPAVVNFLPLYLMRRFLPRLSLDFSRVLKRLGVVFSPSRILFCASREYNDPFPLSLLPFLHVLSVPQVFRNIYHSQMFASHFYGPELEADLNCVRLDRGPWWCSSPFLFSSRENVTSFFLSLFIPPCRSFDPRALQFLLRPQLSQRHRCKTLSPCLTFLYVPTLPAPILPILANPHARSSLSLGLSYFDLPVVIVFPYLDSLLKQRMYLRQSQSQFPFLFLLPGPDPEPLSISPAGLVFRWYFKCLSFGQGCLEFFQFSVSGSLEILWPAPSNMSIFLGSDYCCAFFASLTSDRLVRLNPFGYDYGNSFLPPGGNPDWSYGSFGQGSFLPPDRDAPVLQPSSLDVHIFFVFPRQSCR